MQTIKVRSRVAPDGSLSLKLPETLANQELEVIVVYQSVNSPENSTTPEELGWTPGFFERTAGAWQGEPLERGDQGKYDQRDWDLL